jgi:hypothetical protein
MKFREMFEELFEKVSRNCSDGSGEIPDGPYKGWQVIRTNHLDEPRPPSDKERDDGFDCETFEDLVLAFLKKRPLGIKDDKYLIEYKNKKGYQSFVIKVLNKNKTITFITIMQLNKKRQGEYNITDERYIYIGTIKE